MTTISAELLDSWVRQLRTDTHCSICRVQLRQETSNEQRKERVREQECLAVCAHAWLSDLLLLWGNTTAQISLSGVSYTPTHPGPQTMPRKLYLYSTVFNFIRMVWPTLKKKKLHGDKNVNGRNYLHQEALTAQFQKWQYPYLQKFWHLASLVAPHIDTHQWVLSCSSHVLLCNPIKQWLAYKPKNNLKHLTQLSIFACILKPID